jgi:hypothetical protein
MQTSPIDDIKIKQLYYEGAIMVEIAHLFNVSEPTIRRHIISLNIPKRNRPVVHDKIRQIIANSKMGSKNPNWKGDNVKLKRSGNLRASRHIPCPKGYERHHIDGNPLNNDLSNIAIVTRKEHMILDGRYERFVHDSR